MGEVIQLQGDQRKNVQEFLTDKEEGLELDAKTIKVRCCRLRWMTVCLRSSGPWLLRETLPPVPRPSFQSTLPMERSDRRPAAAFCA